MPKKSEFLADFSSNRAARIVQHVRPGDTDGPTRRSGDQSPNAPSQQGWTSHEVVVMRSVEAEKLLLASSREKAVELRAKHPSLLGIAVSRVKRGETCDRPPEFFELTYLLGVKEHDELPEDALKLPENLEISIPKLGSFIFIPGVRCVRGMALGGSQVPTANVHDHRTR
jgi:hypothetical protein